MHALKIKRLDFQARELCGAERELIRALQALGLHQQLKFGRRARSSAKPRTC